MAENDADYFSLKGGARIGLANVTWPFARLSGDSTALRLSCFRRDYVFDRSVILGLGKFGGLFGAGLLIAHAVPTYPKFIVFWLAPFRSKKKYELLKARLENLGYPI
jgi:hypothetical protein